MARYWAMVPAAGVGRRMAADRPKQYLTLGDRTVLEHSLDALYACRRIAAVVVARADDDPYWDGLSLNYDRPLWQAPGGAERCDSVRNGLAVLAEHAHDDDWVLVHDAARPCLRQEDLQKLMDSLRDHPVGGLLAVPVRDTMKQADAANQVALTLDRSQLWHALTPQMFRFDALRAALARAEARGEAVTDEASAMELAGGHPQLVEGHADNIKITRPEDLALAEFYLQRQGRL
ncbi:2-C-methyl-D-erythritol 4-phosphate cytidylyltransferase [Thiohalobacter sp. IOR34]|uniref:2-C-methyl-D-erythritol 4-phosphate cytidylyltransferase n=1 Tax=Thiohalobacter sp. IOR34 TaxID=3057176 RepID=UPI0025B062F8|nr:2-C-methyl-D-erythritol 4-phosphate cytidylyltransferase [Thiohalobacter sp. IOR34]WJW76597.1 2-C-methyl-D-erythritol 4-phosphate cytidylyltransferase [Thiohalobacter sp. IOR34]